MKFTNEEISLCRQVAKRYRKEIEYGGWFLNEGGFAKVWPYRENCERIDVIPLWTISDCLEFLDKYTTDWSLDKDVDREARQTGKFSFWWMPSPKYKDNYRLGKTPLEACLKAVLAVLEEGK